MCAATLAASALSAEVLKVSSLGWRADDSTEFLQTALDSGASTVVVDMSRGPWVTRPLFARSNQTIVFGPGVELLAKKGAFRGEHDQLLSVRGVSNVTLRGSCGARLRMRKADYMDPKMGYSRSEWRHTLNIAGATNVVVEGLSFVDSGGDGICVGGIGTRNVTIRDCVCDGNNRQGISVTCAENLLIENCILRNTRGLAPQAGIDFEPSWPNQKIVNCVMRNCISEGNCGNGFEVNFMSMSEKSAPVSLLIENCLSRGNERSAIVAMADPGKTYPRGCATFRGCTFKNPRQCAIEVVNKPVGTVDVAFEDCEVRMARGSKNAAVLLNGATSWDISPVDDVEFRNLTVFLPEAGSPDWFVCRRSAVNPARVGNVTGNVQVVWPDGKMERVKLDSSWRDANMAPGTERPMPSRMAVSKKDWASAVVSDAAPGAMVDLAPVWFRRFAWTGHYVFYAHGKGRVSFTARTRRVVKQSQDPERRKTEVCVSHVGGGDVASCAAPGEQSQELSFDVPGAGFYAMRVKTYGLGGDFILERSSVPVALDLRQGLAALIVGERDSQSLWFHPGADGGLVLAKCPSDSQTAASVYDSDGGLMGGAEVAGSWVGAPVGVPSMAGLCRLEFAKRPGAPFYFVDVDAAGFPGFLFLSPTKTWRFAN